MDSVERFYFYTQTGPMTDRQRRRWIKKALRQYRPNGPTCTRENLAFLYTHYDILEAPELYEEWDGRTKN